MRFEQVLDEAQGVGAVVGCAEHAHAGDVDQRPGLAGVGEVVGRRKLRILVQEAVEVVVVDQADIQLAVVYGLHLRRVFWVLAHLVGDHVAQPLLGGVLAVDLAHGGDEGLEGAVGGRPADAAAPLGLGELEDRAGRVGDALGGDDEDAGAARGADPLAVGVAEFGVDPVEQVAGQRGEGVGVGQRAERAGVLRVEDVGGAAVALFEDCDGHLGGAGVADVDLDSGFGLEALDQRADQALAAPGVDRDLARVVIGRGVGGAGLGGPLGGVGRALGSLRGALGGGGGGVAAVVGGGAGLLGGAAGVLRGVGGSLCGLRGSLGCGCGAFSGERGVGGGFGVVGGAGAERERRNEQDGEQRRGGKPEQAAESCHEVSFASRRISTTRRS